MKSIVALIVAIQPKISEAITAVRPTEFERPKHISKERIETGLVAIVAAEAFRHF